MYNEDEEVSMSKTFEYHYYWPHGEEIGKQLDEEMHKCVFGGNEH